MVWAFSTMCAVFIWQSQQTAQLHHPIYSHRPSEPRANFGNSGIIDPKNAPSTKNSTDDTGKNRDGSVTDWLLVLVGALQIGLFYWQLGLIRKSIGDAEKAANAASDSALSTAESVETMKRTAELQLRAYISIEPAGIEPWGAQEVVGHIRIRNAGGVPARDVEISAGIQYSEIGEDDEFEQMTIVLENEDGSETVIPPTTRLGSIQPKVFAIHGSDHEKTPTGSGHLFVWGEATYYDGFSEERRITEFCHRYPCEMLSYRSGKPFIDVQYGRYHRNGNDST